MKSSTLHAYRACNRQFELLKRTFQLRCSIERGSRPFMVRSTYLSQNASSLRCTRDLASLRQGFWGWRQTLQLVAAGSPFLVGRGKQGGFRTSR